MSTADSPIKQPWTQRQMGLGHTVDEQVGNGVWRGVGSAPSWVVGEGHKSLSEARAHALSELEKAEEVVNQRIAELGEAEKERTRAIQAATKAQENLEEARLTLSRRQADLARRCGAIEVE